MTTALAQLREEKRRCLAEEAKSKEALLRRRDRYSRECQLISRMSDELSKSLESFEAARLKNDSLLRKMNGAADANEALKKKIEDSEAEMEQRRVIRHADEATKAKETEALMEEMKKRSGEMKLENAKATMAEIERELRQGDGRYAHVAEEMRRFEARKETDSGANGKGVDGIDDAAVVGPAIDALDAFHRGAAAMEKERDVLKEIEEKAKKAAGKLVEERNAMATREA